jgi:hypothetical protein
MHIPITVILISACVLILFILPHLSIGAWILIASVGVSWFPAYAHYAPMLFTIGIALIVIKGIFGR